MAVKTHKFITLCIMNLYVQYFHKPIAQFKSTSLLQRNPAKKVGWIFFDCIFYQTEWI